MSTPSNKRRVFTVLTLALSAQLLTACIVLPVPGPRYRGDVVIDVSPGHRQAPHHHGHHRDRYWRR